MWLSSVGGQRLFSCCRVRVIMCAFTANGVPSTARIVEVFLRGFACFVYPNPPSLPPSLFLFFFFSFFSTDLVSVTGAGASGAHGWVVGIYQQRSSPSGGQLTTVEARGYPRHPTTIMVCEAAG